MRSPTVRAALGAFFVCAAAGMTGAASAQARTAADCHGIASSTERLACYDAVSGRPAGAKATEPASARTPSAAGGPPDAVASAAAEVAPWIESMVRKASPFPAPVKMAEAMRKGDGAELERVFRNAKAARDRHSER